MYKHILVEKKTKDKTGVVISAELQNPGCFTPLFSQLGQGRSGP